MTTENAYFVKKLTCSTLRLVVMTSLFSLMPMVTVGQTGSHPTTTDENSGPPPKLVKDVRQVTRQYTNVNNATAAGYGPLFGCVSGPDHGAMGVHYVNIDFVKDGLIDVTQPEALIYEPSNGKLTLVGVEYIVDAATWNSTHTAPPVLDGQVFNLVDSPNRYTLAPFYELHVWAWRGNPQGAFVDWNNAVSCRGM